MDHQGHPYYYGIKAYAHSSEASALHNLRGLSNWLLSRMKRNILQEAAMKIHKIIWCCKLLSEEWRIAGAYGLIITVCKDKGD